jgi:hypothetical protein
MGLPKTTQRVVRSSPPHANRRIHEATLRSVEYYRHHPDEIAVRLEQLDREWDIERVLEANASALSLAGLGLGLGVSRRFLAIPLVINGFLLQHAVQGWCPPVSLLRRRGWRTQEEIETERQALLEIRQSLH